MVYLELIFPYQQFRETCQHTHIMNSLFKYLCCEYITVLQIDEL